MPKGIEALKLFNEKAEELANSSFLKFIQKTKRFSFEIKWESRGRKDDYVETKRTLPDQESIKAFILTFRFFIQNNERCSFGYLNQVYPNLPISQQLKDQYFDARKALNQYLDSKISTNIYGETPTGRRLLDVFIYGGLAHATPQKKQVYDQWKKNQIAYGILELEFCSILEKVFRIIKYVVDINNKALYEMASLNSACRQINN